MNPDYKRSWHVNGRKEDGGDQDDGRENPDNNRSWPIIRCGTCEGMATMTMNLTMTLTMEDN